MKYIILAVILAACVAAAGAIVAEAVQAKTPPRIRLAPAVPCTMANHLDVFIDEDNIMWACECEVLVSIFSCRWQVIGGVDPVDTRKHRKHKHLKPKRPIAYTIPAVVA